jgi:hypothetical protein
MFKKIFTTALLTAATVFAASAQDKKEEINGGGGREEHAHGRNCGAPTVEQMLQADPQAWEKIQKLEKHTENFERAFFANKGVKQQKAVIVIPVVVHVVYKAGVENISDAQIQSQIDVLNADFRRTNADRTNVPAAFQGVAADMEIQFQMATRDPNGNATNGITRTLTTRNFFEYGGSDVNGVFVKQASQGGKDAWNPSQYLNMWVCNFGGASADLLGYATFPTDAGTFKDGVVMGYKFFGVNPTLGGVFGYGRTATHEVGHWLNLRHIWGDANCGNDLVSDTPTQQTSNGGCPTFPKRTCGNTTNGDMFMNYMDYVNDQCMNMFTLGQKARAQALFAAGGARVSLLTSPALGGGTATCGTPTALTSSAITATSATVSWTAVSGATSYTAQFKTTAASTWTNVTVSGTSANITGLIAGTAYNFQVSATCGSGTSAFAATTFTTSAGTTTPTYCASKGNSVADEWIQAVSLTRGTTNLFNNNSGKNAGYGNFTATAYNVARGNAMSITITPGWTSTKYAEAQTVWIDYNRDGDFLDAGEQVYAKAASTAATATGTFTIPTTATLGTVRMRVSQKYNAAPTSCETFSYGEVEDYTLNILAAGSVRQDNEAVSTESGFEGGLGVNVYPNPTNTDATLSFYFNENTESAKISIFNLQGQEFYTENVAKQTGLVEHKLNVANLSAGMYMVAVQQGEKREVKKLMIAK